MTDALITDLGKISSVSVISRTSSMQYKRTKKTLPAIARELNVDAIVEGAVLQSANRVRITAKLVEARSDRHLWAESYEGDLRDVLTMQSRTARDIANHIRVNVTALEHVESTGARRVNPEAHEAYLKARYENRWTEDGLKKSIEYFELAIRKAPNYAPAWAGLSEASFSLGSFGFWPRRLACDKARVAAIRAVELDETLSDAHRALALAMVPLFASKEAEARQLWSFREKEMKRAIALNPNDAVNHQTYGYFLSGLGRLEEAVAEMNRARELDPLDPGMRNALGATLYRAGRYDEAFEQYRAAPDPDANSERRHRRMAAIYERKGMRKEAAAELVTAMRLAGKERLAASVEQQFASSGYAQAKRFFLRADLEELRDRAKRGRSSLAGEIAADYALLGDKEKAFRWLAEAFRQGEVAVSFLKVDDSFESLRTDPRFQDLLRRAGLM
jgi:tetratricopeptide (TPR) repeat protein